MSLTINGSTLTQYYSPPAGVPGSTGFTTDRWDVTDWLTSGCNRVRITTGNLCSVYEVQRLEISITATDNRIIIGTGPVLSYYEFKQPMGKMLTDETWRDMLRENPPERPQWTRSFIAQDQ